MSNGIKNSRRRPAVIKSWAITEADFGKPVSLTFDSLPKSAGARYRGYLLGAAIRIRGTFTAPQQG